MKYLEGLNAQQKEAVLHTNGPLMILAGAGAGKTKTITHRIAHLISEGVPADAILAVTFTNKAAGEMRERVGALLQSIREVNLPISAHADNRLPYVSTFHALGVRLLREHATLLNYPRSFTIWDRADSMRAIKASLASLGLEKQHEAKTVLGRISRLKGDGVLLSDFEVSAHTPWERTVSDVWHKYEAARKAEHAMDFDDLLLETLNLLRQHQQVLERCRARWTHLLIDEYQDTNQVQYEIARLLAGDRCNVCVVGDIDQNIYSWRGADIAHLLSFERTFPNTAVIMLEQNYRSTKTIIAAANQVIANNRDRYEKNLFTENVDGEPIAIVETTSESEEARFIAAEAAHLIERGVAPEEIAVLYRANFQSRALEEAFLHCGVAYRVLGTKFFERKEVKDVLSYLRAGLNQNSRGDIARIIATPPRGIGKATLALMLEGKEETLTPAAAARVAQFRTLLTAISEAAKRKPVSEVLRLIVDTSGLGAHLKKSGKEEDLERLENIRELVTLATKYDTLEPLQGAEQLLEDAALMSDQDELDEKIPAVSLMTVHASKGLEFDTVFVTGLEEGLFPHERHDDRADSEEERRLFYVALTRARKKVYLSWAATRMVYGSRDITTPSSFLHEIDNSLVEDVSPNSLYHEHRDEEVIF